MKVTQEESEFKPVSVVLETQKEMLAIRAGLSICLDHWHKESCSPCVNSHIDIVGELLQKLRANFN